ncbi:bacterial transcriptional activator domain-containing protein [Acuticoccus sp. MNP-M23]|uniref:bacterial transcriptional activator domain-containing protein n=1 Tax=Acuticoccus sp. MNP-M23 TaxID=3072793 RepID=UPI0028168E89|nr:bacterial transcriptional activator domain-containing protein [Acuticoccus sp. MNP-M23]WMS42459.1 bacterial transcriptional activator domain-containing protein [Acuticoccus sp. MNP-M23]
MLWGDVDEAQARGSLRKCLSVIGGNPWTASLIARDRSSVWFAGDPSRVDVARFNAAISRRTTSGFREALTYWTGEPLAGMENGAINFDDWVSQYRAQTLHFSHNYLTDALNQLADEPLDTRSDMLIALCELMLRIEPADHRAGEMLIGEYARIGNVVAAARQYRALGNALRDLDMPVPRRLIAQAEGLGIAASSATVEFRSTASRNPEADRGTPTVMLMRPQGIQTSADLFTFAQSEVMCQLARFRSIRAYEDLSGFGENTAAGEKTGQSVQQIGIDPDKPDHDYRLLLWNEPNVRSLYLRCVNTRRMNTVSCVRLDQDLLADRSRTEEAIATAINTIERDILNDEALPPGTVFARWLSAYRELQTFTTQGDQVALEILEDLAASPDGARFSLVHSSIGAITMKRNLYSPVLFANEELSFAKARHCVERALSLDPLEPFNHSIAGWLELQSGQHSRGLAAFQNALSLQPYSNRTLISAAEGHAYCGHLETARDLAARAMNISGRYAPAYFHSYLATIAYLSGDLEECVRRLNRAPVNIQTSLLAVAANEERGDETGIAEARVQFERELRRLEPPRSFDLAALSRWIVKSNMTKDDTTRRRMFASLERAGVAASAH